MSRAGRPLRFLALTLGGWASARAFVLWPLAVLPIAAPPAALTLAGTLDPARWLVTPANRREIGAWPLERATAAVRIQTPSRSGQVVDPARDVRVGLALAAMVRYGEPWATGPFRSTDGAIPAPLRPTPLARGRSRLAGSAWLIARGGAEGTLSGGQLGASQAGARLTYALGDARRVALSARVATPLSGRGKEAAIGIDWQPTRMPLHLIAEQRLSLDGGRGGPTLMVVGGVNPTPVFAGFRLEGYAQAGAIKRDVVEAFGDGAARLTHPLGAVGPVRIDLGGGAWGAAQRGARRLDIGPTIGAVLPIATRSLRMTLDCDIMEQTHHKRWRMPSQKLLYVAYGRGVRPDAFGTLA